MGESLTAELESARGGCDECLEASNGLDLAWVKVTSPAMPLLRFLLAQ